MKVILWARSRGEAEVAALHLGLDLKHVVPVGNRMADSLRGREADQAIILPGANSDAVELNLTIAVMATGGRVVDLRPIENPKRSS